VIEFRVAYCKNDNKGLINNHKEEVLEMFKVKASDRKYQVWERKEMSILL
jgi:hypothetical protein